MARPISRGTESGSRRTRLTVASQARPACRLGADRAGVGVHQTLAACRTVFQGMVTSTWAGRRFPVWPVRVYRRQTSTRASARAWVGVRVSPGSRLAGSASDLEGGADFQGTGRVEVTTQMHHAGPVLRADAGPAAHAVVPLQPRLPAGQPSVSRWPAPWGRAVQGRLPPGPPGLVSSWANCWGASACACASTFTRDSRQVTGGERLPGARHLGECFGYRYLAASHGDGFTRKSGQPFGGGTVSLLPGGVGCVRLRLARRPGGSPPGPTGGLSDAALQPDRPVAGHPAPRPASHKGNPLQRTHHRSITPQ